MAERLRMFLASRVDGRSVAVTGLRRLGGGSSRENWRFDASWIDWRGREVHEDLLLRRDPQSAVVDTGRSTEFAVLQALEQTDVPAPTAFWEDEGEELLRPGMVVARLPGVADRAALRDKDPLGLWSDGRARLAEELVDLLATVHAVDVDSTGLASVLGVPEPNPAEAELRHWLTELDRAELEPQPALRWTARWLRDNLPPPPARPVLVHGDFRPANVLVDGGSVRALLDWELSRIGDPLDDLGWYCAPVYAKEHFVPGRWERADLLRKYTELTGTPVDAEALRFWEVFAMFRLSVIALQGVRGWCVGESDRPAAPVTPLVTQTLTYSVLSRKG